MGFSNGDEFDSTATSKKQQSLHFQNASVLLYFFRAVSARPRRKMFLCDAILKEVGSLSNYDHDHNDDFKKTNRFNDQNNSSAHASRFLVHFFVCSFFVFPLHDYVVKPPNLKSYGGRGNTTTNFPSSF